MDLKFPDRHTSAHFKPHVRLLRPIKSCWMLPGHTHMCCSLTVSNFDSPPANSHAYVIVYIYSIICFSLIFPSMFHAFISLQGNMILIPWGPGVDKAVAGSYPKPYPLRCSFKTSPMKPATATCRLSRSLTSDTAGSAGPCGCCCYFYM